MDNEKQKEWAKAYNKKYTKNYTLKVNKKTEKALFKYLEGLDEPISSYLKKLVLKDMK